MMFTEDYFITGIIGNNQNKCPTKGIGQDSIKSFI